MHKEMSVISVNKRSFSFLLACTVAAALAACNSQNNPDKKSEAEETKNPANPQAASADGGYELPQIAAAAKKIKLSEMPDTVVICTVAGQPITIAEYRRQMKTRQRQFQDTMTLNPDAAKMFLQVAAARNMQLTPEERKRLLDAAKIARGSTPDSFRKFLAQSNMTEEQFDKLVLDEGLASKVFRQLQDEVLLKDLIDRELLLAAAKNNGFANTAYTRFMDFKRSPNYDEGLKRSGLSPELYRDDIMKNFMVLYMEDKISSETPVTDEVAKQFYEKNKEKFKHNGRLRYSQLFVAAPVDDMPPLEGIKSKIIKVKPHISPTELDEAIKARVAEQKRKADSLFARAKNGEDFATLVNENTDEIRARASKNGGDNGFQDLEVLPPDKREKFASLKPGELYPEVLQDQAGFFLIKVTQKEGPGYIPFNEMKPILKEGLKESNAKAAVERWVKAKRKTTEIVLSPAFQSLVSGTAQATPPR